MRVEGEAVICNESGLHARPCHAMVALALEHASGLQVSCGEREGRHPPHGGGRAGREDR